MVHALHSNGANSIWEHSLLDPTNSKSGRKKPQAKDPVKYTHYLLYYATPCDTLYIFLKTSKG